MSAASPEFDGEIIMVGEEFCPNCASVKQLYADEMGEDTIRYIDINEPEAQEINDIFKIDKIPFVVYKDKQTGNYYKCRLVLNKDWTYEIVVDGYYGR
jgi:thiol-disulfide isomerase/thioredoxin